MFRYGFFMEKFSLCLASRRSFTERLVLLSMMISHIYWVKDKILLLSNHQTRPDNNIGYWFMFNTEVERCWTRKLTSAMFSYQLGSFCLFSRVPCLAKTRTMLTFCKRAYSSAPSEFLDLNLSQLVSCMGEEHLFKAYIHTYPLHHGINFITTTFWVDQSRGKTKTIRFHIRNDW